MYIWLDTKIVLKIQNIKTTNLQPNCERSFSLLHVWCFLHNSILFHFVDKPSKPLNLRVTDIWKDYITITWEEPESDGGCPLTGYVIEQRDAYEVGNRFVANVGANTLMHQVRSIFLYCK